MTIDIECPCGARLNIEDPSELAAVSLMKTWHEFHTSGHVGYLDAEPVDLSEVKP